MFILVNQVHQEAILLRPADEVELEQFLGRGSLQFPKKKINFSLWQT